MRTRFTPLNLVSAALLVILIYPLIFKPEEKSSYNTLLLAALIAICFIADIVFRSYLKDLKRIWIVESVFIIFAGIMIGIVSRGG